MESVRKLSEKYFEALSDRSRRSRAFRDYQLIGLQLAEILFDRRHKALYIKLAKEYNTDKLLELAAKIEERDDIRNRGAYFMKVLHASPYYRKKGK